MKRKIIVICVCLFVSIGVGIVLNNAYSVPVLMYHSINEGPGQSLLIVSSESFEKQMRFLKEGNYQILTLDAYVELLKKGKKPAKRSVVITFDDGYRDNYDNAFPVLNKYNIPATIFVVADWIGKENMMDLEQVKKLAKNKLIQIASHGMGHCELDKVNDAEALREIKQSKIILEKKLGTSIDYFCYPCGIVTPLAKEAVKQAGYKAAIATHPDARTKLNDEFAIRRIRISKSSDNMFIFWAQTSGYYTFFKDRRIKRR